LNIEGLKAKLDDLRVKSSAVLKANNDFATARINRDKVLYGKGGIYPVGKMAKDYIRSVTGINGSIDRELGKIRFKTKTVK
jgi:hypothetical protein